jgi:hypothetical protein
MATITKVFEKVAAHNATWLDIAIKYDANKNKILWRTIKHRLNIIGKAVETHSTECFDLLLEVPQLKDIIPNKEGSGFYIAIENYINNPSDHNEHFIIKLLDSGCKIDAYDLQRTINNTEDNNLFDIFFNRLNKTQESMKTIIVNLMTGCKVSYFNKMFEWLDSNHPEWFNNAFMNNVFDSYIKSYYLKEINVDMLNFIISKGVDWKSKIPNTTIYSPSLADYFYNKISQMTVEELNAIPNIKRLCDYPRNNNVMGYYKYVNLPIEFTNINELLNRIINQLIVSYYYSDLYYDVNYDIFYILLKKLSSNNLNQQLNIIANKVSENSTVYVKDKAIHFLYLMEYCYPNIKENEEYMKVYTKCVLPRHTDEFKKQFINMIDMNVKKFEPKPEPKPKAKRVVKKKVPNELEV